MTTSISPSAHVNEPQQWQQLIHELAEPTRSLRRAAPDAWRGFGELHNAALVDGALPRRVKELMALTIAVVKRCDGCIAYHARAAAKAGANPHEVAEALSVTLLMDGGTATVYAPRAWDAFREFAEAEEAKAASGANR